MTISASDVAPVRTDWTREEIAALFELPFTELLFRAATVHRQHHAADEVQLCTLLSIKTGGCAEDCGYCSQSVHADSGVEATKLMDVRQVLQSAAQAKDNGSQRFCMGAAWRNPKPRDMGKIVAIVKGVREMGMETCMTLGMLTREQADQLAEAGLDYYNHNIDTGPEYYERVISTRTMEDRLDTLGNVREAGINVCSGGIVGMGETRADRVGFVHAGDTGAASRKRAGQCAGAGQGDGAGRHAGRYAARQDRRYRICPHGGGRAHHHAAVDGAPLGGP